MKKVMIVAAALLMLGATSCKKSGTCTCTVFGLQFSTESNDMDKDEYKQVKSDCEETSGCTWSDK